MIAPRARLNRSLRRSNESGSAYLAVLMLLVVLTILGLSLSVITQTEVIIGGTEKQTTRQLFAAGSAINFATVHELVNRDSAGRMIVLRKRRPNLFGQPTEIGDRLCTSPFLPIQSGACNLCMVNQDSEYAAVQYGVTAASLRYAQSDLGAIRRLSSVIALEPWQVTPVGYQLAGDEPLQVPDPTVDTNPSTETDPCEGMALQI